MQKIANKKLDDKVIIITGSNCGIGYETALDLAKRNARIILACRDPKRGQDALEKIKAASQNDKIELEILDLASLKSIKEFSERINAKLDRLDILINNAGLSGDETRKVTQDGFEMIFGVNHLGHFYLTNLLLDLLKKSAPSRIINVSSYAHNCNLLSLHFLTIVCEIIIKLK
jgi:retinol dehydrogenase-12